MRMIGTPSLAYALSMKKCAKNMRPRRNRKFLGKKIPRILAGMQGKFSEQEKE